MRSAISFSSSTTNIFASIICSDSFLISVLRPIRYSAGAGFLDVKRVFVNPFGSSEKGAAKGFAS